MIYGTVEISNGVASMSSELYYDMSRKSGELLDAENKSSARIAELEAENAELEGSVNWLKCAVNDIHVKKLESLGYTWSIDTKEWINCADKSAQPEKFESHVPESMKDKEKERLDRIMADAFNEERGHEFQKEVDEAIKRMEESYKIMFGSGVPYLSGRGGFKLSKPVEFANHYPKETAKDFYERLDRITKEQLMGDRWLFVPGGVESIKGIECGQNIHLHIPEGIKTKVEQVGDVTSIKIRPND